MSAIDDVTIALRLFGDTLDPSDVTAVLGVEPTSSCRKGDVHRSNSGDITRIEKTGKWIFSREYRQLELGQCVKAVLSGLPNDLHLWRDLNSRFSMDLFLGLWMKQSNEGFELDADTSRMLADRGLKIGFDVYSPL